MVSFGRRRTDVVEEVVGVVIEQVLKEFRIVPTVDGRQQRVCQYGQRTSGGRLDIEGALIVRRQCFLNVIRYRRKQGDGELSSDLDTCGINVGPET